MTQTTPLTDRQRRSRYYAQNGRTRLTPAQRRRNDKKLGQAEARAKRDAARNYPTKETR